MAATLWLISVAGSAGFSSCGQHGARGVRTFGAGAGPVAPLHTSLSRPARRRNQQCKCVGGAPLTQRDGEGGAGLSGSSFKRTRCKGALRHYPGGAGTPSPSCTPCLRPCVRVHSTLSILESSPSLRLQMILLLTLSAWKG